jgi:hypothetical protein
MMVVVINHHNEALRDVHADFIKARNAQLLLSVARKEGYVNNMENKNFDFSNSKTRV